MRFSRQVKVMRCVAVAEAWGSIGTLLPQIELEKSCSLMRLVGASCMFCMV